MIEPPPAVAHRRDRVLDAQRGADEVEVDRGPDRVDVGLGERAHVERPAGVGEEDVELSGGLAGGGTAAATCSSTVTSATTQWIEPPPAPSRSAAIASVAFGSFSSVRPQIVTWAPSTARRCAAPNPMPLPPPVTRADRPVIPSVAIRQLSRRCAFGTVAARGARHGRGAAAATRPPAPPRRRTAADRTGDGGERPGGAARHRSGHHLPERLGPTARGRGRGRRAGALRRPHRRAHAGDAPDDVRGPRPARARAAARVLRRGRPAAAHASWSSSSRRVGCHGIRSAGSVGSSRRRSPPSGSGGAPPPRSCGPSCRGCASRCSSRRARPTRRPSAWPTGCSRCWPLRAASCGADPAAPGWARSTAGCRPSSGPQSSERPWPTRRCPPSPRPGSTSSGAGWPPSGRARSPTSGGGRAGAVTELRPALAAIGPDEVDLDGTTGLVLPDDPHDDAPDVEPGPSRGSALLPALDPTVMGWFERDWYLGPHRAALFDRNGNAGPTIWSDGRVVGGWAHRADGTVAVRLLEDVGSEVHDAVERRAGALEAWLGTRRFTPRFRTPLERELVT